MNTTEKVATSIRISRDLRNHLQIKAKQEHRSLNNYLETLLLEASDYYKRNETTLAAIREIEEHGDSLKRYNNAEELFADI
ncbi:MAG: toxin-antitoxin system protein [Prevotellaceae bacterium]|jgi:predicted transcriptional regulator|nr:toxin-antitoxin system protein [Prevotellaceae bacterium]